METLNNNSNNILGTNKIPGSERFTRPEEIKALSKYLKQVHNIQDEHTNLGEESLALFGRKSGKLVNIEKLSDHEYLDKISDDNQLSLVDGARPMLDNESEDVIDLLQKKIQLAESENNPDIKLVEDNEKLKDTDKELNLSNRPINILPDETNWTNKLVNDVVKLKRSTEDPTLNTEKIDLDIPNKVTPLSKERLDLDDNKTVQSLRQYQELDKLDADESTPLSTIRENLSDHRDIQLDNHIDELQDNRVEKLDNYKENIRDERTTYLNKDKVELEGASKEVSLNTEKEDLEVENNLYNLPTNQEKISDAISQINLSNYRDDIEGNEDIKNLPEEREDLGVKEELESLPTDKLTIEDKGDPSLSDYRESINVSEVDSLSNQRIDIKADDEIELPEESLKIKQDNLFDILPDKKENILNNYGLSEITKLSDTKDSLSVNQNTSSEDVNLSDYKENLKDDRESSLSTNKEKLLGEKPDVTLEEEAIQIAEGLNRAPSTLEDGKVLLEPEEKVTELDNSSVKLNNTEENINQLSDFIENLDLNNTVDAGLTTKKNKEFQQLENHQELLKTGRKVNISNLEDAIFVIDNDTRKPIDELPNEKQKLGWNKNQDYRSRYINEEALSRALDYVESTKNLTDIHLFNRIMKLLQDLKSGTKVNSPEWISKTEALLTTYFDENNKQKLKLDLNDNSFIKNWINSITVGDDQEFKDYYKLSRLSNQHPENDLNIPRVDYFENPINREVIVTNEDGEVIETRSFLASLINAHNLDELTQLINLYKENHPVDLKTPESSDNPIYKKWKENEDKPVGESSLILDTLEKLQEDIASRKRLGESIPDVYVPESNKGNYSPENDHYYLVDALLQVNSLEELKEWIQANEGSKSGLNSIFIEEEEDRHTERETKIKDSLDPEKPGIMYKRPSHKRKVGGSAQEIDSLDPTTDLKLPGWVVRRGDYKLPNNVPKTLVDVKNIALDNPLAMITNPGTLLNYNKYLRYVAEVVSDYLFSQYTKGKGKLNGLIEKGTSKLGADLSKGLNSLADQIVTNYTGIPTSKRRMLEETLAMLVYMRDVTEKNLNRNRGRLPGQSNTSVKNFKSSKSISKALLKKAVNPIASLATGGLSGSSGARNRPSTKIANAEDGTAGSGKNKAIDKVKSALSIAKKATQSLFTPSSVPSRKVTEIFLENGRKSDKNYEFERKFFGTSKDSFINVADRFNVPGVLTTLADLAEHDGSDITSLEDFKDILMKAPHITTPGKFSSTSFNGYKSQTLSSNSYWEVLLEPFVHSHMNGGFSYLPSIREINVKNLRTHGIYTGYNEWLPITSFELEKAKLTTKSLGLYEGEIVYPVGCEFLNELTITMINDSLKSWSGFWRTVMDVSTYNSEPHDAEFYKESNPTPTAIDYSAPMISLYKNITWRCKIYILSPQFSTIKKFDLLVVLKDYTESYSGDIDSPGNDVQLRFSVVGENPPEDDGILRDPLDVPKPTVEFESTDQVETTTQEETQKKEDEGSKETTEEKLPTEEEVKKETATEEPKKDEEKKEETETKPTKPPSTNKPKDSPKKGATGGTGNVYYAVEVTNLPSGYHFKLVKRTATKTRNSENDPYAVNFQFNDDGSIKSATMDPSDALSKDRYFSNSKYSYLDYDPMITNATVLGEYRAKDAKEQNLGYVNWADYFYSPDYMSGENSSEEDRKETRDNLYEITKRKHKADGTYYRN